MKFVFGWVLVFFLFSTQNQKSQKVSDWFESYVINSGICRKLIAVQVTRVDLHTPKMLIIQFHTSSVWKIARHTIFIQFLKMVEKRKKTFFLRLFDSIKTILR